MLRFFSLDQAGSWSLSSFARLEHESYCKALRVINCYCSIVCFVLKHAAVSVYKKDDQVQALAEVFLSHAAQTRLISYIILLHIPNPFIPPFLCFTRYLEYGQTVNMKLWFLVMTALALRVAAAPIEVDTVDVADAPEDIEARGNWCGHAGITCW